MDSFVDERDYKLLENDRYTFFVLSRIMGGKCDLLLTDHERLIICYSCSPYPVWIWTEDNATEEDIERAYTLAKEHSLLDGGHRFNLKYNLAHYFIERAAKDNKKLSICTNMYAYDCHNLLPPTVIADGHMHSCNDGDIEELANILDLFHRETNTDQSDYETYRLQSKAHISEGHTYFWKDSNQNTVASCKYVINGDMASINLVFTRPEYRRRHYAENLVYRVTKIVMDAGYVPMLYTDADYIASNACYEKIGYVLKGKLCTIG